MSGSTKLKRRALLHHNDIQGDFLEFIKGTTTDEDDAADIEDMQLFMTNIISNNEDKMQEGLDTWIENMLEPLDPKKARYAKPIDRILADEASKHVACVYHAVAFMHLEVMLDCSSSDVLKRLDLKRRFDAWSEAQREEFWSFMRELNRTAFAASDNTPPRVPTRDEISLNIKTRRTESSGQPPSMNRAFVVAYGALMESRNGSLQRVDDALVDSTKDALGCLMKEQSDTMQLISAKDDSVLERLAVVMPDIDFAREMTPTDWDLLSQMCTLCNFERAIPGNIMQHVETFAQKLASDMASGKRDMSSLANFEAIGEELMSKIDPDDISKLGESADNLMPMLDMLKGLGNFMPKA